MAPASCICESSINELTHPANEPIQGVRGVNRERLAADGNVQRFGEKRMHFDHLIGMRE
jgi:hypothetical protein